MSANAMPEMVSLMRELREVTGLNFAQPVKAGPLFRVVEWQSGPKGEFDTEVPVTPWVGLEDHVANLRDLVREARFRHGGDLACVVMFKGSHFANVTYAQEQMDWLLPEEAAEAVEAGLGRYAEL
jgi:hypothetical protein